MSPPDSVFSLSVTSLHQVDLGKSTLHVLDQILVTLNNTTVLVRSSVVDLVPAVGPPLRVTETWDTRVSR